MKPFVLSREAHLPVIRAAWERGEIAIQNVKPGVTGRCANRSVIGPCIVGSALPDAVALDYRTVPGLNRAGIISALDYRFFYALQALHDRGMSSVPLRGPIIAALHRVLFDGTDPVAECEKLNISLCRG